MISPTRILDTASEWLYEALSCPDGDVILTSPYLAFDVCKRIADAKQDLRSWILLTTMDPSAVANGYLSVEGLSVLLAAGVEVRHVERLHAKCFIIGTRAMLGSANLTGAGLGSSANVNRELGVELDPGQAVDARNAVSAWPARTVGQDDLDVLLMQARNLTRNAHGANQELDAESALRLAEELLSDARDPQRRLWLKLEHGEPALDGWRKDSWFASPDKGKPTFRPGDLVFICANDTKDCYAVVEVTREAESQPEDYVEWSADYDPESLERWPWINRTKPRLVPSVLMELKFEELRASAGGLQNGHIRLKFDEFTAGVRALARIATV